MNNYTVYTVF